MKPPGLSFYTSVVPESLRRNMHEYFYEMEERGEFTEVGPTKNASELAHMVMQFGYTASKIKKKIPPILQELIIYVPHYSRGNLDQCIVNKYLHGEGITQHTDSPCFGELICCYSFGETSPMVFTNPETSDTYTVTTTDNSLYIMENDARYKWKHHMPNLQGDIPRYSVTFRSVD